LVELSLQARELASDDMFNLVGKFRFYILLQTTKQEWTKHLSNVLDVRKKGMSYNEFSCKPHYLVQSLNNKELFFFIEINLILYTFLVERRIKPFLKTFHTVKDLWQNKVQQCPKFWKIVLKETDG
jgi:hypothetical protein